MIPPTRATVMFPINSVTAITLFGAATNITLIVSAIAIRHFSLMLTAAINLSVLLMAAYFSRKYIVLQINLTPVYGYGPLTSVTLDNYTVTSERAPTPVVSTLSSSMVAPIAQQAAQTGPASNPATASVISSL